MASASCPRWAGGSHASWTALAARDRGAPPRRIGPHALLFIHREILGIQFARGGGDLTTCPVPKRPQHLPIVLTRDEAPRLSSAVGWCAARDGTPAIGAGLDCWNAPRANQADIDFCDEPRSQSARQVGKDRMKMVPTRGQADIAEEYRTGASVNQRDRGEGAVGASYRGRSPETLPERGDANGLAIRVPRRGSSTSIRPRVSAARHTSARVGELQRCSPRPGSRRVLLRKRRRANNSGIPLQRTCWRTVTESWRERDVARR